MSSSKFASLEGVDYDTPDVFETRSPSPSRKNRGLPGNRVRSYGSSDDNDDDESDEGEYGEDYGSSGVVAGSAGLQKKNRKVGQAGQDDARSNRQPNADIVRAHLNADEAARVFRDATGVNAQGVDFSSSIHRQRRRKQEFYPRTAATFETHSYSLGTGTGYRMAGDEVDEGHERDPWQLDSGEKESPVDRFRRLRFEMEELERELKTRAEIADSAEETHDESESSGDLLPQLHTLREQLTRLDEQSRLGESKQRGEVSRWQAETRKLLQSLAGPEGQMKQGEVKDTHPAGASTTVETTTVGSTRLGDLDQRLAGLESLIGIQDALQDEAKTLPRPMLPALARIEHLLTLLTQPRHLDGISRRIKVLVSELERVHEARRKLVAPVANGNSEGRGNENGEGGAGQMSEETLKQLDGVLPLLSRIEPMLPVVPTLLARLQSLSSLHASSASFAHDVETLESIVRTSHSQNEEVRQMLKNVQESFAENEKQTKANLTSVEERVEAIVQRMEALSRP